MVLRSSSTGSPGWLLFELHSQRTFAAAAGSASGLDFSRFPAMTAGGTVRTLRMQADDGGQRSVCPQEGVEQAVKGVPGFDVVGRRGRALMRFRHCLAWADLVRRCDE